MEINEQFSFGLEAQGHIPVIDEMLAAGRPWEAVAEKIGWERWTAEAHYLRHKLALSQTEVKRLNDLLEGSCEETRQAWILITQLINEKLAEKDTEIERLKKLTLSHIEEAKIVPWDNGGLGVLLNGKDNSVCVRASAYSSDCFFVGAIERLTADNQRMRTGLYCAVDYLKAALPHIECENSIQNELITAVGEYICEWQALAHSAQENNRYNCSNGVTCQFHESACKNCPHWKEKTAQGGKDEK